MHIISNSLVTRSYSKQNCQWILELWSKKENKHPCRIAQKHWFSSSSSLWRFFFKKNEFLIRNHQSRPTGSESFPEVNAISSQIRGRGQGQGRGRNPRYHGSYGNNWSNSQKKESLIAPPDMEQYWGKTRKWEVFTR